MSGDVDSPFTIIKLSQMLKYIIVTSGLIVSLTAADAQYAKNYKKAADKFYKQGDYYSAAQYYEKSLAGNKAVKSAYEPYQVEKRPAGETVKAVNPRWNCCITSQIPITGCRISVMQKCIIKRWWNWMQQPIPMRCMSMLFAFVRMVNTVGRSSNWKNS